LKRRQWGFVVMGKKWGTAPHPVRWKRFRGVCKGEGSEKIKGRKNFPSPGGPPPNSRSITNAPIKVWAARGQRDSPAEAQKKNQKKKKKKKKLV